MEAGLNELKLVEVCKDSLTQDEWKIFKATKKTVVSDMVETKNF